MAAPQPVTWIRKDFHVHESHSKDAPRATVEKYCRMAESRGIDEIAFTTHLILWGRDQDYGVQPHTISNYLNGIEEAQESTDVSLRTGLEIDYFPQEERRIEEILEDHPLDFALGSLHFVEGYDIGARRYAPIYFAGKRLEDALDTYFSSWRQAVESGLFDVMAHPDYFRRHLGLTHQMPIVWEQYGSTVYDAIDSLRSSGVGFSVNASGMRHGIGDVYPISGFIEAAREAGVETVTVGSDSHKVEDLGVNTLRCVERLEDAGYTKMCTFEKRRNRRVSLSDVRVKPG
jgi:histidinol-phosphatase (PHP family)